MISVGFERVSKKRPYRICGKPTYCGFSRDEGTSICMRISAGSRGLSSQRWKHTRSSRDSIHHDSTKNQECEEPINFAGSFGNQRRSFSGVHKALSGLELHKGTCHRPTNRMIVNKDLWVAGWLSSPRSGSSRFWKRICKQSPTLLNWNYLTMAARMDSSLCPYQ